MDLKDVVESVYSDAGEAHKAFHAGHRDTAEEYLAVIEGEIGKYITEHKVTAGDVTESATSETETEQAGETPAAAAGAAVQPGAIHPDVAAQQKALDKAGP